MNLFECDCVQCSVDKTGEKNEEFKSPCCLSGMNYKWPVVLFVDILCRYTGNWGI